VVSMDDDWMVNLVETIIKIWMMTGKYCLVVYLHVSTYPSEKYDFVRSSDWDDFPFPTVSGKS